MTFAPNTNFVRILAFVLCSLVSGLANAAEGTPLLNAHAHNDYLHDRPLLDALALGYCCIEVDIWLAEGELLVGHERSHLDPERTLSALYLEPLRKQIDRNGGRVYRDGPEVTLLIDIKTSGRKTYPVLRTVLEEYEELLTTFRKKKARAGALRIVITGNPPRQLMRDKKSHLAGYDGRPANLELGESANFMPLISTEWPRTFSWVGQGEMPHDQHQTLLALIEQTHAQNRKLRFYATPESEVLWRTLLDASVDYLGTDDLNRLAAFLRVNQ